MARRFDRLLQSHLKYPALGSRWSDKFLTSLEGAMDEQDTINADLTAAQADIASTQSDLANTVTDLTNAVRSMKIGLSWTSPGAILSAADVGSDCTITIANHTRKYGDGSSLSITGGTITGRAFSTTYYVYYTDSSMSDTTPNFLSTTNPNTAAPNATTGRHFCGAITTPADGGGGTSGGTEPPGGDYGGPESIP